MTVRKRIVHVYCVIFCNDPISTFLPGTFELQAIQLA
jgi:hypothetical protein